MTKKLLMTIAVVGAVAALAFIWRPSAVDRVAYLNAVRTDAVHVFGESRFIGCPNTMHKVQQPPPSVAVESMWTNSLEETRKAIDPNAYDRGNHIAINWHGNFEKPSPNG